MSGASKSSFYAAGHESPPFARQKSTEARAPEEDLSGRESSEILLWFFWRQNSSFGAVSAGNAGPPPIAPPVGVE